MKRRSWLTLSQRLSLVFALLLLVCCGVLAWLQIRSSRMHEQEVVQSLSRDLAETIARDAQLLGPGGLQPDAARQLFNQLMTVNPSVEVYLLGPDGVIVGHAAPSGKLRRAKVSLDPVQRLLSGRMLPIFGDDPRSENGQKVFSAAPLEHEGRNMGYVYVVLLSEAHDRVAAQENTGAVLRTALLSLALVAFLCLIAGIVAFALITRPLRNLATRVRHLGIDGSPTMPGETIGLLGDEKHGERDEIAVLEASFHQMSTRLHEQWQALLLQDQDRRELFANISHDLRTPLSSMHGYLETLQSKEEILTKEERHRYLGIAIDQSKKVANLAQKLFELARLEHGFVQPEMEDFALPDLVQDVFAKFELQAHSRTITLRAQIPSPLPRVHADIGLIERVLTNLLDNALRHTPSGGEIEMDVRPLATTLSVTVSDTGPGVDPRFKDDLFERPFTLGGERRDGGLGLLIVYRILQLHGATIRLVNQSNRGATFQFELPSSG